MPGKVLPHARYLGPQVSPHQNYGAELIKRIAAMKKSYYECGAFWSKANIPYRWKRAVLLCRVINTGLSCIECFLPTTTEYRQLQSAMGALLRKAMRGRAT
eukprot:6144582-Pyramimonas_sp.AAC.1